MEKVKLGQVLDVTRGMSLSGNYYATSGRIIRLTLGNFNYPDIGFKYNTSKKDLFFTGPFDEKFLLKKGDVITPLTEQVRGLLGNTAFIPLDRTFLQSGDIGLIIPNESKILREYAYYLLSSSIIKKQLASSSQQTKIRHTSPEYIKGCIAWLPAVHIQHHIVDIM